MTFRVFIYFLFFIKYLNILQNLKKEEKILNGNFLWFIKYLNMLQNLLKKGKNNSQQIFPNIRVQQSLLDDTCIITHLRTILLLFIKFFVLLHSQNRTLLLVPRHATSFNILSSTLTYYIHGLHTKPCLIYSHTTFALS